MKHRTKSIRLEQEQQEALAQQGQQQSARQFSTVEEVLRYDAAQTPVPLAIAKRLQQSTGETAPPARSWWRRLLGR